MKPPRLDNPDSWRDEIPAQWVVFASINQLREITNRRQFLAFVWPDEGAFDEAGMWHFNVEHFGHFQPLLVDALTAERLLIVRDSFSDPKNQATFDEAVMKGRGEFGVTFEFVQKNTTLVVVPTPKDPAKPA